MRNKYFIGTYGWDKLSKTLALLGVLLATTKFTFVLGIVIMLYAFTRTMSKNFEKREKEERAFEDLLRRMNYDFEKLKYRYNSWKLRMKERKEYVIIKCPNCSQKLRLPRHKGNIVVTCKKCSNQFKHKT